MKLLHVTTFQRSDCAMLLKRCEYQASLCGQDDRHAILIPSADVHETQLPDAVAAMQKCYNDVQVIRIDGIPRRTTWPIGTNFTFSKAVRIVHGQMRQKPDLHGARAFLYYETDMTPLTADWAVKLDETYETGKKPFAGYIHTTTMKPTGRKVKHMNGAGIYPIGLQHYTEAILLAENVPWDVFGLGENKILQITPLNDQYIMAFSSAQYKKDGNFLAYLKNVGNTSDKLSIDLSGKVIHHGCKDGSLIDILAPVLANGVQREVATGSFPPPPVVSSPLKHAEPESFSWQTQAKADQKAGMKWLDLIKKYKKMPKDLKAALA